METAVMIICFIAIVGFSAVVIYFLRLRKKNSKFYSAVRGHSSGGSSSSGPDIISGMIFATAMNDSHSGSDSGSDSSSSSCD